MKAMLGLPCDLSAICLTLIAAIFPVLAGGQQAARMIRLPAPPWTGEASSPAQHVYYDSQNHQIVIVPPATGGAPAAPQRFDLPDGTRPIVTSSVSGESGSALAYSYQITDSPDTFQRTARIDILLPSHDSGLTGGGAWPLAFKATNIPDRTATVAWASMRWAYLQDPKPTPGKLAGLSLSLTSTYLPGFADAVAEGYAANPISAAAVAGFDAATAAQLQRFLDPYARGNIFVLLAPMFRPGASELVIASNYNLAIQQLARGGALDANSPFVVDELNRLRSFLEGQGEIQLGTPAVAATSPLEKEIQQAMSIALQ